jgi:hypothetical protein
VQRRVSRLLGTDALALLRVQVVQHVHGVEQVQLALAARELLVQVVDQLALLHAHGGHLGCQSAVRGAAELAVDGGHRAGAASDEAVELAVDCRGW